MSQKCTANKTNGEPCEAWAVKGTNVCVSHGGNAPQVKEKGQERLRKEMMGMLPKALKRLKEIIDDDEVSAHAKIKAIESVITRIEDNTDKVEHEVNHNINMNFDFSKLTDDEREKARRLLKKAEVVNE